MYATSPWRNPQSREAVSCWVCDDGLADETIFLDSTKSSGNKPVLNSPRREGGEL